MQLLGREVESTDATIQVKAPYGGWLDWLNIKDESDIRDAERMIDDPQYRIIMRSSPDRTLWNVYHSGMWEDYKTWDYLSLSESSSPDEKYDEKYDEGSRHITSLGFTQRTQDSLLRGGIETLDQLKLLGDERLLTLRNFGQLSLQEVRRLVPEPQRDKTFTIYWAGTISWSGFSIEDAIEDFKASSGFGTLMKQLSHFEESR